MLLMAMTTSSFAMNNGLYVGFGVGALDVLPEITLNAVQPFNSSFASFTQGNTDISGVIVLGYTYLFNDYFGLGMQVDGQVANSDIKFRVGQSSPFWSSNASFTTKFKDSGGVSVRPAFLMHDTATGYLILGYRRNSMSNNIYANDFVDPFNSLSFSYNNNGFEYGIGTEICLGNQISIRLEATQTAYQSKSFFDATTQGSFTSKVKANQGLLSLVWYPNFYID